MQTIIDVKKLDVRNQDSITVNAFLPYTIVFKHLKASTPIWVYIISILSGILLLAICAYILYRIGFFKRKSMEEMENESPMNTNNIEVINSKMYFVIHINYDLPYFVFYRSNH